MSDLYFSITEGQSLPVCDLFSLVLFAVFMVQKTLPLGSRIDLVPDLISVVFEG